MSILSECINLSSDVVKLLMDVRSLALDIAEMSEEHTFQFRIANEIINRVDREVTHV